MITGQIDSDQADYIESVIHEPSELTWVLEKVTSGYYENCPNLLFHEESGESPQLVKPVFAGEEAGSDEWIWNLLCQPVVSHAGFKAKDLMSAKINMILPQHSQASDFTWHTPHVDSVENHKVLLYYVSDSNAPTYFFKERFDGTVKDTCTFDYKVLPKKGSYAIFDGDTFHASSPPSTEYRSVINFNFYAD
jgi:hypothetical protein